MAPAAATAAPAPKRKGPPRKAKAAGTAPVPATKTTAKKAPAKKKGGKASTKAESTTVAPDAPVPEDKFVTGFYATEFMKIERFDKALTAEQLQTDIHPIFAKQNFLSVSIDYNRVITPVVILATQLLEADALQPFFYTMLANVPVLQPAETTEKGEPVWAYTAAADQRDRVMTPANKQLVEDGLVALADMVGFFMDPKVDTGATTVIAMDTLTKDNRYTHPFYPATGRGSFINYSPKYYRQLDRATKQDPVDWPLLRSMQFLFAVALVHEVSHAVYNARMGDVEYEPFFGDSLVSEVGYEAEDRLFGGHLRMLWETDSEMRIYHPDVAEGPVEDADLSEAPFRLYLTRAGEIKMAPRKEAGEDKEEEEKEKDLRSGLQGVAVMFDWPYRGIYHYYWHSNFLIAAREGLPSIDLAWRTRLGYFHDVTSKDFWINNTGTLATRLRPPRGVGHYFTTEKDGETAPRTRARDVDIPTGYRRVTKLGQDYDILPET